MDEIELREMRELTRRNEAAVIEMRFANHPSLEAYRSLARNRGVELRTVLEHVERDDLGALFRTAPATSIVARRRALLDRLPRPTTPKDIA